MAPSSSSSSSSSASTHTSANASGDFSPSHLLSGSPSISTNLPTAPSPSCADGHKRDTKAGRVDLSPSTFVKSVPSQEDISPIHLLCIMEKVCPVNLRGSL
jgi:uncharacterized membrane protein